MPIYLKGIQTKEDAMMAIDYGCQGCVVSNHGGRQLDYARSGIEALAEIMPAVRARGAKFEVFVDGGVRRGSDIFKALAMGASGVGIGRPVLYGLSTYGQAGIEHVVSLLYEELCNTMMMTGCASLADIRPEMVVTDSLYQRSPPPRHMQHSNYRPLSRL